MPHIYETDGAAIYLHSFAMIRAEADLARFTPEEEVVAVRMIHAAGMVGLEAHVRFSPRHGHRCPCGAGGGAPILCDARMVSEGITRPRLPAGNQVICTLQDPAVPALAAPICRPPGPPRRWNCGGPTLPGASSPSAMRPRRCFTC